MFKKRPQRKDLAPSQRSLTSFQYGHSQRSIHTTRVGGVSKDSKTSLKSQKRKQSTGKKPPSNPAKSKPKSNSKGFKEERKMHLRCQSVDLMGQYEKMLELSRRLEARVSAKGKYPVPNSNEPAEASYFIQSPVFSSTMYYPDQSTYFRHEPQSYGSCKPEPTPVDYDDLTCDEELDKRTPFPILRTPQRLVHTTSMLDRYGMSELSVVEERIISEEEKEFVSDKKKKVHARMPTLSTAEKILCSANTAATTRQHQRAQRTTSPFQIGPTATKPKKPVRISINVNALVGKAKRTRHK